MKIIYKLFIAFLLLSCVPLVIQGLLNYGKVKDMTYHESQNKLDAIRTIKKRQIEYYYHERINNLYQLAKDETIKVAALQLPPFFSQGGIENADYKKSESEFHPVFKSFIETYGFYDLFLITMEGDVIYSVAKESDLGTNLINGDLKESNFGQGFKQVLEKKAPILTPIDFYAPSNDEPAQFLLEPIQSDGKIIGILAFQIPLRQLYELMKENTGLGETGETYLVNTEGYMLSQSRFREDSTVLKQKVETDSVRQALSGESGFHTIRDYRGVPVLSSYQPIEIMGNKLALLAEIDEAEAMKTAKEVFNSLLIQLAAFIFIVLLAAWFIAKQISRPIQIVVARIKDIAEGNGDLTKRVEMKASAEIGQLVIYVNKFIDEVHKIVKATKESVLQVAASAEQLAVSVNESSKATQQISSTVQVISEGSESQLQSISDSSRAIEEMSRGIQRSAENASAVAEISQETSRQAHNGNETIQSAVQKMESMAFTVEQSMHSVHSLNEHSKEIGDIITLIKHIAVQTNLLSLNAAIESARAGEYGRGFAVVAGEIRKLASQTTQSTEKVASIIQAIQSDSQRSAEAMQQVSDEVIEGLASIREASDKFRQIVDATHSVAAQVQEVSAISEQLSAGTEQVSASFIETTNIAQETATETQNVASFSEEQLAIIEEITSSCEMLSSMAQDLRNMVDHFKV